MTETVYGVLLFSESGNGESLRQWDP